MRIARQVIVALLVGGLFGVPPLFGQTPSDWAGVWSISFPDAPESSGHWVISNEGAKVLVQQYDTAWQPETVTVNKVDTTALSITRQERGFKVVLTVTRQGDRLSGISKLVHVQYTKEQQVNGLRVIKANHWEPLEGVRSIADAAGLADVSSVLRKAALGKNLQKFLAAWDSEIGGPYYVFLDRFWDPDPARKSEKLRQLYQMLRSSQFAENLKTALALRAQVVQLVKDKQPSFYFANPTVVLPSLSSADASVIDVVKGKIHIKMEVPEKLPAGARARLKWLIAREEIKLGFLVRFPLQVRTAPIEMIRQGISGYLAADLVGVSLPDLLGTVPPKVQESLTRLDTYRKVMGESGNTEIEQIRLTSLGESLTGRQIVDLVGYKFGEQVLKRFNAEELAKLDRARLLELGENYLRSGN